MTASPSLRPSPKRHMPTSAEAADGHGWNDRHPGSLQEAPAVVRRYYFSTDGLDRCSERLPAARHFDVLLERGEGTEGPNLIDEINCRYVDFLKLPSGEGRDGGLLDINTSEGSIQEISLFLDRCRPRTRLDGYPLYIILKDMLRRMLSGKIKESQCLEDEVASLRSHLATAAAERLVSERKAAKLRTQLRKVETQLHVLAAKEHSLQEELKANAAELAAAAREHAADVVAVTEARQIAEDMNDATAAAAAAADTTVVPEPSTPNCATPPSSSRTGSPSGSNSVAEMARAVRGLSPQELAMVVAQLPAHAAETLLAGAMRGANVSVRNSMLAHFLAPGHQGTGPILAAAADLDSSTRQALLRRLWEQEVAEVGGGRPTPELIASHLGLDPSEWARLIAEGWEMWGPGMLRTVLLRVGGDPVEQLEELMASLDATRAQEKVARMEILDEVTDALRGAVARIGRAYAASWGASRVILGRQRILGFSNLRTALEELTVGDSGVQADGQGSFASLVPAPAPPPRPRSEVVQQLDMSETELLPENDPQTANEYTSVSTTEMQQSPESQPVSEPEPELNQRLAQQQQQQVDGPPAPTMFMGRSGGCLRRIIEVTVATLEAGESVSASEFHTLVGGGKFL